MQRCMTFNGLLPLPMQCGLAVIDFSCQHLGRATGELERRRGGRSLRRGVRHRGILSDNLIKAIFAQPDDCGHVWLEFALPSDLNIYQGMPRCHWRFHGGTDSRVTARKSLRPGRECRKNTHTCSPLQLPLPLYEPAMNKATLMGTHNLSVQLTAYFLLVSAVHAFDVAGLCVTSPLSGCLSENELRLVRLST